MDRTLAELYGMLKTAEESIKKNSNHVMVMHKRKPNNKKTGQKRKLNSDEITSTGNSKTKVQKTGPAKDTECFFCKETGHWKRNCRKYLEHLKQMQQDGKSSTLGINVIEINLATSSTDSWVFDSSFSMKDLGEAVYILGIRIYRDRSNRLIGLSQSTYIDKVLKRLNIRTKVMFLVYGGQEELVVNGYTDASFQTDKDDFRSQSGFVFCLNGGAVSWKSSKQDIVADSTTKPEYIAASEAAKEAVWINKFVSQLGVMASASSPMDLYCDNSGAIAQAKEPRSHQKSKHILRRYHLIHEIVGRGDVKICKIHMDLNVADPLTKPLP
uniref:Retrotransposon protein, putative, Ty1-copia subclass n=1 Tax=Oryza sativa subsp. japonica TaxID=39947 RepID=Q2QWB6_ORYSJ|nr:retrotransposon protein, putative, Ty1-copia subclass [Oryza sativa Japonica Group]